MPHVYPRAAMTPLSVFRDGLFDGKTAVVTGGGSGIGKAIAIELGRLGAKVMIGARKQERLEAATAELTELGIDVAWSVCNIREDEQIAAMMAATVERFGSIDILVNNAGGQFPSPAGYVRTKGWKAVQETNLQGTFVCCREAYTAWMQKHGGAIVNIVADMWRGFPGMVHTGAARAGVVNMTQTLAVEWAHNGIRVNGVAPGIVMSSGVATYDPFFQEQFLAMKENIPAKRLGTVWEVASAVAWLASQGAAFVSGDTLRVDGAGSLWRLHWEVPEHTAMPPYGGE